MRIFPGYVALHALAVTCLAQTVLLDRLARDDQSIFAEIQRRGEVIRTLQHLCDEIGPRVTGSPAQRIASEWVAERFRSYGLSNVRNESWPVTHSWTRGTASASLVSPVSRRLTVSSTGWSRSTAGMIRGPVVFIQARSPAELERYRGKLRNAVVLYDRVTQIAPPGRDVAPLPGALESPLEVSPASQPAAPDMNSARMKLFEQERIGGVLRDSGMPHGLLNTGNGTLVRYMPSAVPVATTTHEDYSLILRLLAKGPVQIEMQIANRFSEKPVEAFNTVAEIPGAERPAEIVILAAHLDSWDLGTGCTDDGAGALAVLEAARALAALKLKPLRTIRFVLFTGEEQGLAGSRHYVRAHASELRQISAVLVHDTGTGPILTIALHHNYQAREAMDAVLSLTPELALVEPKMAKSYGSDYAAFNEVGVPAFSCIGSQADYSLTHHSQADTFDKVQPEGVVQASGVLAIWAYNVANLPMMVPRRTDQRFAFPAE